MTEAIASGDTLTEPMPQDDPFRYGWRYVVTTFEDGSFTTEQVPLTHNDVLYPQEDDFVVQTDLHERTYNYLTDVLRTRVELDSHAVVLHDCRIAWAVPELQPNGLDIAVIFGVQTRRNWATFDCAEEGTSPTVVIEVTSPTTRGFDFFDKVGIYALARIPWYVIADVVGVRPLFVPRLLGYQLTPRGYEPLALDERGWLWLPPVRLWLGVHNGQVVCADEAGTIVGDYAVIDAALREAEALAQAESQARREAEAVAQAESQARRAAEARLRDLEAEVQRLRSAQGDSA